MALERQNFVSRIQMPQFQHNSFDIVHLLSLICHVEYLASGSGNVEKDVLGYCKVVYDYSATEPNQISIAVGDHIAIINKAGGFRGWWKGRLNGKVRNLDFSQPFLV